MTEVEQMTVKRVEDLCAQGWVPVGVVMRKGNATATVVGPSVTYATPAPDHPFHPDDGAERYTGGPEGTNWPKGWAASWTKNLELKKP